MVYLKYFRMVKNKDKVMLKMMLKNMKFFIKEIKKCQILSIISKEIDKLNKLI